MNKIFLHGDMDGISCRIVLKYFFDGLTYENFEIVENPSDLLSRLQKYLKSIHVNDHINIVIADLAINQKIADIIIYHHKNTNVKFIVFDHHKSSVELLAEHPEYDSWLYATTEKCGCKITFEYLDFNYSIDLYKRIYLKSFIDTVDQYDRGIFDDVRSTDLNILFHLVGQDGFIKFVDRHMESYIYFNEEQYDFKLPSDIMPFIKQRKSEMESLVYKTAESGIYSKKILGHTVAVTVLNTTDLSIICSKILELKPEYDYIINFNFDLMQAQLRTLKDDIDLAEIASRYGGGGHKKASGFPINKSHINNLLNNILGITTNKHEEWHK